MKKNKNLYLYGVVLLSLAILDLVMFVISAVSGEIKMVVHENEGLEKFANFAIICVVGAMIVSILINAYLGIKGIKESTKPSGSKLHILIAKLLAILNIIVAVCVVVALFKSDSMWNDIWTLCVSIVDVVFMFSYAKEAKKVRGLK